MAKNQALINDPVTIRPVGPVPPMTASSKLGRAIPTRPRTRRAPRIKKDAQLTASSNSEDVEIWQSSDGRMGAAVINRSGIPTRQVLGGQFEDPSVKPLMDAMVTWTHNVQGGRGGRGRQGNLYERDLFVVEDSFFEQVAAAYNAADDDVVGAYLSSSEALAFGNIKIECDDEDEENIWEQITDKIDLSSRMREIWHELAITGQAYIASWYGTQSFKVQGKNTGTGVKRKKPFNNLTVPLGLTVLDPFKVIATGNFLFNQETLVYIADPTEKDVIDSWLLGDNASGADPIIQRLIVAKYEPDYRDRKELVNIGGGGYSVDPNRLYVLNPKYVWRHTLTRPAYSRFAPVPMRRIFELLDLKRQLKAADRAALIGVAQFIILITKGTDKHPADQYEIDFLQTQASTMGGSPVLIGDHRLHVEIITPKTEHIIDEGRYGVLNLAIQGSLYGMFMTTHAGRDDSLKLARVVARGLESRRDMQRMSLMDNVFTPIYELNDSLTALPRMAFHPKRIALDFDPSLATYLLDLRDRGDLSRKSTLAEVDYDEADEAKLRQMEIAKYDKFFQPPVATLAPANSTAPKPGGPAPGSPSDPKVAGRSQGGNHDHGGNGGKARGAGQAPISGTPKEAHGGTSTPPGSSAVKGIRSRPRLEKHGQTSELEDSESAELEDSEPANDD